MSDAVPAGLWFLEHLGHTTTVGSRVKAVR